MKCLEVSGAVRPLYGSLGVKGLILYTEITAVCSQIHTNDTNTLCGKYLEFLSAKLGGAYSDHWSFRRSKVYFRMHLPLYLEAEMGQDSAKNDH